jgi:tetratricopeptide (TPR) repeat protein
MATDAPSHPIFANPEGRSGADVIALAPPPRLEVVTRRRLPRTQLAYRHGVPSAGLTVGSGTATDLAEAPSASTLVTRRQAWLRRRRRWLLAAVAVALALFPPMWAVYLVAWMVWRRRPRQRSMRLVRRGVRALEADRMGLALRGFQEAHLLDPSNTDALYWLGLLLSRQERHGEAEEALSLVAERVPGLPEVEGALADAYVALGDPAAAVYHAQRLAEAAPYAPEALLKLADAFEAAGREDLAVEALERAPLHGRRVASALLPLHYRLGALYERGGDAERALYHFKRVYAQDIAYEDVRARVEALEAGFSQ